MSKHANDILILQGAIQQIHKCEAIHQKTVLVDEKFEGKTLWCGNVEIFELVGHPKAAHCFAWMHQEEGKRAVPITLLDRWPLNSPQSAVKTAIALDLFKPFREPSDSSGH